MPPDWLITTIVFVLAVAGALALHDFAHRQGLRFLPEAAVFWRSALSRSRSATRLALVIVALALAARVAPLSERETSILQHALLLGFIALAALTARSLLDIWMGAHLRRFRLDVDDNLLARKHVTQMRILRRIADTVIVVVALAAVMMTFEGVRQYGVSLLASAGAAGIVVGLALQPLLKNLFAGIQLALTQPIRIDDAVIVEGEWGNIEEITSTYVVVRIWDRRRLIVPLSYFIEQPFQNWTREEATLIGSVTIYLDYAAPVDLIRAEAGRIVHASKNWDRDVVAVQVTDFRETVMEVRILASAGSAGRAFDLRCEIREGISAFLREHHAYALPTRRVAVDGHVDAGAAPRDGRLREP